MFTYINCEFTITVSFRLKKKKKKHLTISFINKNFSFKYFLSRIRITSAFKQVSQLIFHLTLYYNPRLVIGCLLISNNIFDVEFSSISIFHICYKFIALKHHLFLRQHLPSESILCLLFFSYDLNPLTFEKRQENKILTFELKY